MMSKHAFWNTVLSKMLICMAFSLTGLCAHGQEQEIEEKPNTKEEGIETIEEVIVTGIRASLAASIDRKRNAEQLIEVITAEDIGKFPDQNVAESLQRLTGVQINRGANISVGDNDGVGEGSEVSVRGTPSALNRATVNGQTIATASSQGGSRSFNFNTISPELVESLEVFKTPAANMDEGSLGGTVNLKTRSPLDFEARKFSLGFKKTSNRLRDDQGESYSFLYADAFAEDRLGILFSYNKSDEPFRRDSVESFGYRYVGFNPVTGTIVDAGNPAAGRDTDPAREYGYMPKDIRQNLRLEERERTGINAVLQWHPTDSIDVKLNYLGTELERNENASNSAYRFTDAPGGVGITRIAGAVLEGDNFVAVNGSRSNNVNHRRQFVALLDRRFTSSTDAYGVEVAWHGDLWKLSTQIGYSEGEGVQDPSLFATFGTHADISYDTRGVEFFNLGSGTGTDFADPSIYRHGNGGLSRALRTNEDEEFNTQFDIEREIESGWLSSVQFGVKYRDRSKTQVKAVDAATGLEKARVIDPNTGATVTLATYLGDSLFPVDDFKVTGGLPSEWGFPDADRVLQDFSYGGLLADPTIRPRQDGSSNWDLTEKVIAGYAMADFSFNNLSGNFGVRVVNTDQTGNSNTFDGVANTVPVVDERSYTEVLPSLNAVYILRDDLLLRGGVAKVMSRPSFQQLTLGYNINLGAGTATRGNPDLDPFLAWQADLSLEWYFAEGSLLAASVFYKDIESFVTQTQATEVIPGFEIDDFGSPRSFLVTSPENGEGARIKGLEVSYQQNFTFLPSPLDGFGALFNITFIDSSTGIDDPFGKELPLEGLSDSSRNMVLFYERGDFSARVSYTHRDDFLIFTSSLGGLPVYQKAYDQVDANVSYAFRDTGFLITFEAINLNNEAPLTFAGDESRLISYREYGRRFALGIRYNH